jgi:protein SCO1/2
MVGIALIGFIVAYLPKNNALPADKDDNPTVITPIAGFNQGAHFTLTHHDGSVFDSKDEISEGEFALLFFGFTHCPVICPTELQKFASVMDDLPEDIAAKLTPIFITIDPERDTVEVLNEYVPLFHPSINGLTGDIETVHQTLENWKVFFTKVDDPQFTEYTMDHSTYAYFVNHNMQIAALFRMKATADDIVQKITQIVQ